MRNPFRKNFLHDLVVLVIPIVIQNLITSTVQMANTIMLGRVSQTALSASSLAGQSAFLLYMFYPFSQECPIYSSMTNLGGKASALSRATTAHAKG